MTRRQKIILSFALIPVSIISMNLWGVVFDSAEKSSARQSNIVIPVPEECMFDLATQTDEFLKTNSNVDHFEWSNKTHEGIAYMKNGDTLEVIRGGCNHFLYECSKNLFFIDQKDISLEAILESANRMAKDFYPKSDAQLIDSLIKTKDYIFKQEGKTKYWHLNYEGYAYIEVAFSYWDDTKHYTLSVGYMMN